ncbi:NUDIX domain-containing protein [Streptomyces pristinaespiralis]|uniref:NUDIX domain-containing protein n=1 Tax=Streptomyces pristinaespiralis TaxID=38300 RepID=UPI003835C3C0
MSATSSTLYASAAALFFDAEGAVLIVNPTYKDHWNLPGGAVDIDKDETPHEAAAREVREELGITPPIGRLLVHAWLTLPGRGAQVLYVYDGGILGEKERAAITLQESELSEYRFCHPDAMERGLIPPHLAKVWHAALTAHASQTLTAISIRL